MTRWIVAFLLVVLTATCGIAGNTSLVDPPTALSAGQKILASTHNDNYSRIFNEVRGNIGTLNLLDGCLSADAAGRAKMANSFLTWQKVLPASAIRTFDGVIVARASTTTLNATFTQIVLTDGTGFQPIGPVNNTLVNSAASGAGGLDTGSIANNTTYHIFAIAKSDATAAAMISVSDTSPTLPTDYTYKKRIGTVRTNGSAQFVDFVQLGKTTYYRTPQALGAMTASTSLTAVVVSQRSAAANLSVPITARAGMFKFTSSLTVDATSAGLYIYADAGTTAYAVIVSARNVAAGISLGGFATFWMPLYPSLANTAVTFNNDTASMTITGAVCAYTDDL